MRRHWIVVRVVIVVAIIYMLVIPLNKNQQSNVSAENNLKESYHKLSSIGDSKLKKSYFDAAEEVTLDHKKLVAITEKFINLLVQENDDNYKVINYSSKDSLLEDFKAISTIEVAKPYVDYYFEEAGESLYIIPTETPPWFEKNQNYEMMYKDDNIVVVRQMNESELYGEYKITLKFTYNDRWRLTEVSHL